MPETVSENFSVKTTLGAVAKLPLGLALKFGLPVSVQYAVYAFFTQIINITLVHSHLNGWVAAVGVTALAYMGKHFYRQVTKPSLFDGLVELAKYGALIKAAQQAQDEHVGEHTPYL